MLFNLVFSKLYAVFYDLSSLIGNFYSFMQFFCDLSSLIGNFYSFSVDIVIVLTFVGRFMHLMHVYLMQSW